MILRYGYPPIAALTEDALLAASIASEQLLLHLGIVSFWYYAVTFATVDLF